MLAEYALTPQIFDQAENPDPVSWRTCLEDIWNRIHRDPDTPCPIILTGLHGSNTRTECTWMREAVDLISSITDTRCKRLAEAILKRAREELMVIRPARTEWPPGESETGWFKEASSADRYLHLPMTIGSQSGTPEAERQDRLDAVRQAKTWGHVRETITPEGSASEQIELLKPLLTHGQHYLITKPYNDSMNRYLIEVLAQLFTRPEGYERPVIEICHGSIDGDPEVLTRNIRTDLHARGLTDADELIRIHHLRSDKYRERVIIGSALKNCGAGTPLEAPRWGVSMTHVPGEGSGQTEPSTWSVLSLNAVMRHRTMIKQMIGHARTRSFLLSDV